MLWRCLSINNGLSIYCVRSLLECREEGGERKKKEEASFLSKPKLIQQQEQGNSAVLGWRKDALDSSHSRDKQTYIAKMPEFN